MRYLIYNTKDSTYCSLDTVYTLCDAIEFIQFLNANLPPYLNDKTATILLVLVNEKTKERLTLEEAIMKQTKIKKNKKENETLKLKMIVVNSITESMRDKCRYSNEYKETLTYIRRLTYDEYKTFVLDFINIKDMTGKNGVFLRKELKNYIDNKIKETKWKYEVGDVIINSDAERNVCYIHIRKIVTIESDYNEYQITSLNDPNRGLKTRSISKKGLESTSMLLSEFHSLMLKRT